LQSSTDPLAVFKEAYFWGRERKLRGRGGEEKKRREERKRRRK